ncbi:ComEA family DNA-binding protein [Paenibacillus sp. D2_2]|uniref:ComEA family DNA-binding protein n=1 Tax=Paenibacillus sp. D2_2 TaxID=3073092 RepID=UPI002814C4E9|nr:ComEA family DNA-binding protein [Paenibacillus sp. D2_2]WMT42339.1 ComEA family DNA-binding protein [Paenibacillus sp. D2_2]
MNKGYVITSICSAFVGAVLMLLALGGGHASGIQGWTPVNREVQLTLQEQEGNKNGSSSDQPAVNVIAPQTTETLVQGQTDQASLGADTVEQTDNMGKAEANAKGTGPSHAQPENEGTPPAEAQSQSGLININTAGAKELQEIPGIGEKKAQAIMNYRNENGPFKSVEDLTKVKGIGAKMLEKMKPYIGLR